jgi:spermidine synthase
MKNIDKLSSGILKFSLLATGIAGVVAEYILATLASYFLPDATVQWTMIISIMLFSMGIGSRLSKYFVNDLLDKFVFIEFLLSLLVSFSASIVFVSAGRTIYFGIIIYALSIMIGLLIGMEIPLVTRINERYEELRLNIANVMSWDYIGSLFGGIFFVFIGMPYLGMDYTPFALGILNFLVASVIVFRLGNSLKYRKLLKIAFVIVLGTIAVGSYFSKEIILFGEQKNYKDKIVHVSQSRYQKIVITQKEGYYWLFINGNQQLSSFDEWLYHEPLVHPAMQLTGQKKHILVMGGGDGCAVKEVLKYNEVESVTVIDLDSTMINLSRRHPALLAMNKGSFENEKVQIHYQDAFLFNEHTDKKYDLIIVDLPDPRAIDINKLYTRQFYKKLNNLLTPSGILITQAGSPYFATKAFYCIEKTFQAAGFNTLPLHNQVLTMGEWGWMIGSKQLTKEQMIDKLAHADVSNLNLRWMTNPSLQLVSSFGKPLSDTTGIEINTLSHPVLPSYYIRGNWNLF